MATAAPPLPAPSYVPARVLGDDALARRISAGDERAFEELYRRYRSPLYRYCASMVGSPEEGEEALQAVMLSAYRTLSEPRREIAVRPWLYRVAHNQCLDALRRRRATAALTGLEEERGPGVDERSPRARTCASSGATSWRSGPSSAPPSSCGR